METKTKTKLPRGFKRKWATALRSGRYTQGSHTLYDPKTKSYDPIGVAYRICGVPTKRLSNRIAPIKDTVRFFPKAITEDNGLWDKLVDLNDNKKMSFRWMASYIEDNL